MMEFKSKYAELTFYVDGKPRKFSNGRYVTDDKKEIEVLDGLIDAERCCEEPKQVKKAEDKPAVKEAPAKKASK